MMMFEESGRLSGGTGDTSFGSSVSTDTTGRFVAVGSPFLNEFQGRITIFDLNTPASEPDIIDEPSDESLGQRISLSDDGAFLATTSANAISVYQTGSAGFERIGTRESQGASSGDIAISGDGQSVAFTNGTTTLVVSVETDLPIIVQAFGSGGQSVAISTDGTIVAVGTPSSSVEDNGIVTVYELVDSAWEIRATVQGLSPSFGFDVAISGDGNVLVIGAPDESVPKTVQICPFNGSDYTSCDVISDSNANAGGQFGSVVSVDTQGKVLAVGSSNDLTENGVVQLFNIAGDEVVNIGDALAGAVGGTSFGQSLEISGNGLFLIVGSTEGFAAVDGEAVHFSR